ncbi:hypothetical protein [Paenibacillus abyssi]|uniref:ATPase n=1 Tax=Paenibacillus abyssi TaxID=1340531 RepID=A0A917D4E8_9BACL|nr:hypothetical protein [Paenibacillus abyssi]GGG11309.1 ATPase [Paenibacillus abyssi]
MQIFGLYGKSGTGKSHKSMEVKTKFQIDAVIDDGILIINKIRVAGRSAKNEQYLHAATKRAIFHSEAHRREVREAIEARSIRRLLIIGTSQKMILRIIERLHLPPQVEWIPVEQFQTDEELNVARERRGKGYHIIPIQPIEVERTYTGWFRKFIVRFGKRKEEITLIKPFYSGKSRIKTMFAVGGRIIIHPQAIKDIIYLTSRNDGKLILHDIKVEDDQITIVLSIYYGETVRVIQDWKGRIEDKLTETLGIRYHVNVEWKRILPVEHPFKS